jgi:hypothetical protein
MNITTAQTAPAPGALAAQALFESMTGPEHKTDTRRPRDLGHHVSPSATERATWRKVAA